MNAPSDDRREQVAQFLERHGLKPDSLDLVAQALIHRSYAFEHDAMPDNERLEFLGDAVLGCLAADFLFQELPGDKEGELSVKKAFLVSRVELGRRGEELGLADLVLLGRGEESSGGRGRSSIVGSTLEALIGALYFEVSFEDLRRFARDHVLIPGMRSLKSETGRDYKSRLQELLQKRGMPLPIYARVREEGPAHRKRFAIEASVDGRILGWGAGARIKSAENEAAREAYDALRAELSPDEA